MGWDENSTSEMEVDPPITDPRPDAEFAKYVESCRRKHSSDVVFNTSIANTKIVIENLLLLAIEEKAEVRLVSGILNSNTYTPMVNLFVQILDASQKVKILTLCSQQEILDNPLYRVVSTHHNGRTCSLDQPITSMKHFMLIGDSGYRIELDDITKEAYACFNDTHKLVTNYYKRVFKEKWNACVREGDAYADSRTFRAD